MNIYRAGLTGCLAACVIPESKVYHLESEPVLHKAVLRFRTDEISKITGIPFKKIKVSKSVFDGDIFCNWDPQLANQYSKKVINGLYDRSIANLETVDRWLAPADFHEQLIEILNDRIYFSSIAYPIDSDFAAISTLPLPELMSILNEVREDFNWGIKNHFNSIYVSTVDVKIPSEVHQTIYFPEPNCEVYRATLEGRKLIIECTEETEGEDLEWVPAMFGLDTLDWEFSEINYKQKIGKIAPIEEIQRKELICMITEEHNIYSLGRTAIWKNILLDDCLQDVKKIQEMLNKSRYDRMLGR